MLSYYAIKDNVVGRFGGLVLGENDEAVKRQIKYQLLLSDSIYAKSPQDFDLWHILLMDDEAGQTFEELRFVCALSALKGGSE